MFFSHGSKLGVEKGISMKTDSQTAELPGLPPPPKRRGRKPTGKALSNAERQARFRAKRQQIETGERMTATIRKLADEFDLTTDEVTRHLLRFALCNRNWSQTGFPTVKE